MRTTIMVCVVAVLLALASGCPQSSPSAGTVRARAVKAHWIGGAPDFTFAGVDKKEHRASEFAGKPLVINFWAKG